MVATPMTRLLIRHETRYDYQNPVSFGVHRLMIRPRDSHAIRIISANLTLSPPGSTRWAYDALGNCVCWFQPLGEADSLTITSEMAIERFPAPLAPIHVTDPQTALPMVYSLGDRTLLEPFMAPATADDDGGLTRWLRNHLSAPNEPALNYLQRINKAIFDEITYTERYEAGTLEPSETLRRAQGACRDVAWLMTEALRRLGYAARFVSGYLYAPQLANIKGAGATHAWVQVFLPDLGWIEFDPTNNLTESADLIPVAVARTPDEAAPISGTIIGYPNGSNLTVSVDVHADEHQLAPA